MKALRAGKAVFNDKPFTTDPAKAQEIADYAAKNHLLITGGSGLKNIKDLDAIAAKIGPGSTVVVSYAADTSSDYQGYWFYGIHAVELAMTLCGRDYKSVSSFKNGTMVVSSVAYADKSCIIATSPGAWEIIVSITNGGKTKKLVRPQDYNVAEVDEFIDMLKTKKAPRDYGFYVDSIRLLGDIIASAK